MSPKGFERSLAVTEIEAVTVIGRSGLRSTAGDACE
jgi:hypothetical protein